ncbi:cyclic nucleotide-binding domain-containing protein [Conexibacter sp. W3-3-2]|nr:cyclic nucleotide-binding domain-containing protein [Conexibacter sp. W3-3-2]
MTGGIPTFWSLLDEPARQLVREHGRAVEAPAGERMLTQHEEADAVIVLLAGAVRITAQSPGGKEMLLGLRGPGELLGELAALDGQPRAGSAEAFADVRALALSGTVFRRLVQERPGISRAVLVTLATRLRDADAKRLEHVGGGRHRPCGLQAARARRPVGRGPGRRRRGPAPGHPGGVGGVGGDVPGDDRARPVGAATCRVAHHGTRDHLDPRSRRRGTSGRTPRSLTGPPTSPVRRGRGGSGPAPLRTGRPRTRSSRRGSRR